MNRRTRTFVVVGVAVVLAAIASFGVFRAIQNIPERQVAIPERFLVVATKDIRVGFAVEKTDVRLAPWPVDAEVPGAFATLEEVVGRAAIAEIVSNEPITERKLALREAGLGLPPMIPAGMRAMSVRVDDVIGVSGFVVAGSKVDVIVTLRRGTESLSRAVLSNIQILASGTKFDQEQAKSGQAVRTHVVTVLVTPQNAERLALASMEGSLTLVLRNPLDLEAVETQGAKMTSLGGAPEPKPVMTSVQGRPRVVAAPPPPPPPPKYTVDAIRGATRKEEIIR